MHVTLILILFCKYENQYFAMANIKVWWYWFISVCNVACGICMVTCYKYFCYKYKLHKNVQRLMVWNCKICVTVQVLAEVCICCWIVFLLKMWLQPQNFWKLSCIVIDHLYCHLSHFLIWFSAAGVPWHRYWDLGIWDHNSYLMFVCDAVSCCHWN